MMRLFVHLCLAVLCVVIGLGLLAVLAGPAVSVEIEPELWQGPQFFHDGAVGLVVAAVITLLVLFGIFLVFGLIALMVVIPAMVILALLVCGFSVGWPLLFFGLVLWLLWPSSKPSY